MFRVRTLFLIFTFLCMGLSACATAAPISTATPSGIPTATLTRTPFVTVTPEPTPTPQLPESLSSQKDQLEQAGYVFEYDEHGMVLFDVDENGERHEVAVFGGNGSMTVKGLGIGFKKADENEILTLTPEQAKDIRFSIVPNKKADGFDILIETRKDGVFEKVAKYIDAMNEWGPGEPVAIQRDIVLDGVDGEKVVVQGFFLDNPSEDPETLESQQVELLNLALEYMVDKVDWGNMRTGYKLDELSQADINFIKAFAPFGKGVSPSQIVVGTRVPSDKNVEDENAFLIGRMYPTGYPFPGTFARYKEDDENSARNFGDFYIQLDIDVILSLINQGKIDVPEKPEQIETSTP